MLLHQTVYIIVAVRADSQTIFKLLWFQGQIIILTTKGTKYNDAMNMSILVWKNTIKFVVITLWEGERDYLVNINST